MSIPCSNIYGIRLSQHEAFSSFGFYFLQLSNHVISAFASNLFHHISIGCICCSKEDSGLAVNNGRIFILCACLPFWKYFWMIAILSSNVSVASPGASNTGCCKHLTKNNTSMYDTELRAESRRVPWNVSSFHLSVFPLLLTMPTALWNNPLPEQKSLELLENGCDMKWARFFILHLSIAPHLMAWSSWVDLSQTNLKERLGPSYCDLKDEWNIIPGASNLLPKRDMKLLLKKNNKMEKQIKWLVAIVSQVPAVPKSPYTIQFFTDPPARWICIRLPRTGQQQFWYWIMEMSSHHESVALLLGQSWAVCTFGRSCTTSRSSASRISTSFQNFH